MNWITVIGFTAAFCTSSSFLPQVIKAMRTKQTKDLSLAMASILTVGIFLWLVYGIIKWDIPIIAANSVTLVFTCMMLVLKLRYG